MAFVQPYPFHRLSVDHMIRGTSRVWWELEPTFQDPLPHSYQLQAGFAGTDGATDWVNVGSPVVGAFYADDADQRLFGKRLLTHYRVIVTTPRNVFVSAAETSYGYLSTKDWITVREIARKERLRGQFVSVDGFLLKRMRCGPKCTVCLDPLTEEVTNSYCTQCGGTGLQVGYFPPVPFLADKEVTPYDEEKNEGQPPGQKQDTDFWIRAAGFPLLAALDIWANGRSGERFQVNEIEHSGELRGTPVVARAHLTLLPYTHYAYRLQLQGEPADLDNKPEPTHSQGCITVDQDYGGPDELSYTTADGCGIEGATVLAFTKANYDAGNRTSAYAIAKTATGASGRWTYALRLDPGQYVLVYAKIGEYGPDTRLITVSVDSAGSSFSSSISSSSRPSSLSESFGI